MMTQIGLTALLCSFIGAADAKKVELTSAELAQIRTIIEAEKMKMPTAQRSRIQCLIERFEAYPTALEHRYVSMLDVNGMGLDKVDFTAEMLETILNKSSVMDDFAEAAAFSGTAAGAGALVVMDRDILNTIQDLGKLNDKYAVGGGSTVANAYKQIFSWVAERQRDQFAALWCYGEGQ